MRPRHVNRKLQGVNMTGLNMQIIKLVWYAPGVLCLTFLSRRLYQPVTGAEVLETVI